MKLVLLYIFYILNFFFYKWLKELGNFFLRSCFHFSNFWGMLRGIILRRLKWKYVCYAFSWIVLIWSTQMWCQKAKLLFEKSNFEHFPLYKRPVFKFIFIYIHIQIRQNFQSYSKCLILLRQTGNDMAWGVLFFHWLF